MTKAQSEVAIIVERVLVTLGYFGVFAILAVTGHLTGEVEAGMLTGLGAIVTMWFGGSSNQVRKSELENIMHEFLTNVPTIVQSLPLPASVKTEVDAAANLVSSQVPASAVTTTPTTTVAAAPAATGTPEGKA